MASKASNFFVTAQESEAPEKRVSRFKQWFNRSRVGMLVKERRYFVRGEDNPRKVRQAALMRAKYRAEHERKKYYQ